MQHVEEVTAFVIREFLPDMRPEQLDSAYDLTAGGVIDSLGLLKVVAWLENRYQLRTEDLEITPDMLKSVDTISEFIKKNTIGTAV